jgi:hypothetical protein
MKSSDSKDKKEDGKGILSSMPFVPRKPVQPRDRKVSVGASDVDYHISKSTEDPSNLPPFLNRNMNKRKSLGTIYYVAISN